MGVLSRRYCHREGLPGWGRGILRQLRQRRQHLVHLVLDRRLLVGHRPGQLVYFPRRDGPVHQVLGLVLVRQLSQQEFVQPLADGDFILLERHLVDEPAQDGLDALLLAAGTEHLVLGIPGGTGLAGLPESLHHGYHVLVGQGVEALHGRLESGDLRSGAGVHLELVEQHQNLLAYPGGLRPQPILLDTVLVGVRLDDGRVRRTSWTLQGQQHNAGGRCLENFHGLVFWVRRVESTFWLMLRCDS